MVCLTLLWETGFLLQSPLNWKELRQMSAHLLYLQIKLVSQHTLPFLLFHLGLPTTTKLSRKEQMAVGSRPDTVTCSTGNSLLFLLMVTSLVSSLQPIAAPSLPCSPGSCMAALQQGFMAALLAGILLFMVVEASGAGMRAQPYLHCLLTI